MSDFTSAVLTRLLFVTVKQADPALVSGLQAPDPMMRGISPVSTKLALIERVMHTLGPSLLLRIGESMHLVEETPLTQALSRSPGPLVLAEKWMRLERYQHATHRTRISALPAEGPFAGGWKCHRLSDAEPASRGENILIAGLLRGLLHRIGTRGVSVWVDGCQLPDDGWPADDPAAQSAFAEFSLKWLLAADGDSDLPSSGEASPKPSEMAKRVSTLLMSDISRSWRLDEAAHRLAASPRSIQRRLAEEGRNFNSVLRQSRMRAASALLTDTATSLSEIGYCCGYADQAHFQRDFRRVTNITPAKFRAMAGSGQSGAIAQ